MRDTIMDVEFRRSVIRPRKIITRASIFLLLVSGGAIVNVAVAWGLAAWMGFAITSPEVLGGDQAKIQPTHQLAVAYQYHWPGAKRIVLDWNTEPDPYVGDRFLVTLPNWCSPLKPVGPIHEVFGLPNTNVRASGWPMLTLGMSFEFCFGFDLMVRNPVGGIRIADQKLTNRNPHDAIRFLPLTPIWPGFAINTLFYAAILWLLFAAPFAFRRMRRLKRGLCPACAYPVGTSDLCTECGKPVNPPRKPRNVEPASA